jgi:Flp pilus assembly protein TadD
MAKAAANRNPKPKAPAAKQPKPSREVRKANRPVEETLFFTRMRNKTKWVFGLLVVVFAFSFVVAGVGSGSTGVGSVFDAFGSLFGSSSSSSGPSLSHALKALQKNPKDAAADLEAAKYYLTKNEDINAVTYYEDYVKLRPKDAGALRVLASLYQSQAEAYNQAAQSVQPASTSTTQLGQPDSSSALGKATSDPFQQYLNPTSAADQQQQLQYQQYVQLQQQAELQAVSAYKRLVSADPTDPTAMIAYGRSAIASGDTATGIKVFRTYLKKFPDDSSATTIRAQLKQLTRNSSG